MQPNDDHIRKLREWTKKNFEERCSTDPITEEYNGFTIELRLILESYIPQAPKGGTKFFIITPDGKIYTNGYIYYDTSIEALNAAYEAIDNGEVPDA